MQQRRFEVVSCSPFSVSAEGALSGEGCPDDAARGSLLKLAILTDIHHGQPRHTKRGDKALQEMDKVTSLIREEAPDLIFDLGDRITDADHATDRKLMSEVAEAFAGMVAPIHHICGNHDRCHLSVAENEEILGQELVNELLDVGSWQIVLWRAEAQITWAEHHRGFDLPESDLLWLAHQLAAATKPTLVLSHVPISGHSQIGNYYFQENPSFSTYPQAARVRQVLTLAQVPVVWLSGHVHWNSVTHVDGIPHLTQQSLTESFTTQGEPAGAWAVLELGDQVQWSVRGRDPFACTLPIHRQRWVPPLTPFLSASSSSG